MWLTVNVINFEEKFDLVIRTLTSELVHGIDKFLQWNATIVIFVENVKYPFNKKWLKYKWNKKVTKLYIHMYVLHTSENRDLCLMKRPRDIYLQICHISFLQKKIKFSFPFLRLFPNKWPTVNVDKSVGAFNRNFMWSCCYLWVFFVQA